MLQRAHVHRHMPVGHDHPPTHPPNTAATHLDTSPNRGCPCTPHAHPNPAPPGPSGDKGESNDHDDDVARGVNDVTSKCMPFGVLTRWPEDRQTPNEV